jgi:hypothetical protein
LSQESQSNKEKAAVPKASDLNSLKQRND